jgi:hypothetical protein
MARKSEDRIQFAAAPGFLRTAQRDPRQQSGAWAISPDALPRATARELEPRFPALSMGRTKVPGWDLD